MGATRAARIKRDHHGRKMPLASPDGTVSDGWLMRDGSTLESLVTSAVLLPEVEAQILNYSPRLSPYREAWSLRATFVLGVMMKLRPPTVQSARNSLVMVTRISYWALKVEGVPLDVEEVFHPRRVEQFVSSGTFRGDKALKDYRPRLRVIGRQVTVKAPWEAEPERFSSRPLSVPYTSAEVDYLYQDIPQQYPTVLRAMRAVHHLGLGTGARSGEIPVFCADDLEQVKGRWCATLGIGGATRLVVIEVEHVPPILELAEEQPSGPLVHARADTVDLDEVLGRFHRGNLTPRPSIWRYRSKWLLGHLTRGTRLDVLRYAAGVRELSGVLSLLKYLPALDPAEAQRWMAGEQ